MKVKNKDIYRDISLIIFYKQVVFTHDFKKKKEQNDLTQVPYFLLNISK